MKSLRCQWGIIRPTVSNAAYPRGKGVMKPYIWTAQCPTQHSVTETYISLRDSTTHHLWSQNVEQIHTKE